MRKLLLILFLIPNIVFAGPMKMIGEKGNPTEVNRTITIKMHDNYFEPSEININKDETIKFIVLNVGELVHEFNIATKEMHIKHQPEMMMLVENEILLSDKVDKDKMKQIRQQMFARKFSILQPDRRYFVCESSGSHPANLLNQRRRSPVEPTICIG